MDMYASDPMGGGVPLPAEVKARLRLDLLNNPGTIGLIAWRDETSPSGHRPDQLLSRLSDNRPS